MTNNKYYYCYNPFKKRFLAEGGLKYVLKGTHSITNKMFWVYEKGSDLDDLLKQWRIIQEQKFN